MKVRVLKPTQTKDIHMFDINSLYCHVGQKFEVIGKGGIYTLCTKNRCEILFPNFCCKEITIVSKLK